MRQMYEKCSTLYKDKIKVAGQISIVPFDKLRVQ